MVNKVALDASDDKRLQRSDGIISYAYGTGTGGVSKGELIEYIKMKNLT